MAEGAAIVRSFRVGKRTATLTIQAPRSGRANYVTGWSPDTPPFLTRKEMRQYRVGRSRAIAELARLLNIDGDVLIIES
jgi:hypothetical protein